MTERTFAAGFCVLCILLNTLSVVLNALAGNPILVVLGIFGVGAGFWGFFTVVLD